MLQSMAQLRLFWLPSTYQLVFKVISSAVPEGRSDIVSHRVLMETVLFRLDTTDRNMPSSVVDRVAGFNVQGDGLASQGLHEDLHCGFECRIESLWNMHGTRKSYSLLGRKCGALGVLGVGSSVSANLKNPTIAEPLPVKQLLGPARRCHESSSFLLLRPRQPKPST